MEVKMIKKIILIFTIILFLQSIVAGKILNVPQDFSRIQMALMAADSSDTVLVQPGTYVENIIWPSTNGIKLISAGNWDNTIIDGNQNGTVMVFLYDTIDTTTLVKGFTITNGSAEKGAGILCNGASPKLIKIRIKGNHQLVSNYGGGGFYGTLSNAILDSCEIINNYANYAGGGIYTWNARITVRNTVIAGNVSYALNDAGGGGIFLLGFAGTFENVLIEKNTGNDGAGIFCSYDSNPKLINVVIRKNKIFNDSWYIPGPTKGGAGLKSWKASPFLKNCLIINNISPLEGQAAVLIIEGSATFKNSIIANNSAFIAFNGIYPGNINIENTSIVGNDGRALQVETAKLTVTNCTIVNNNGGIFLHPQMVNNDITYSNIFHNGTSLLNNANDFMINAKYNYWGDATGPYHPIFNPEGKGDTVSTYVDVIPFFTEPDTAAPPIPVQNVEIVDFGDDFIKLKWDSSQISDLAGYKIYFDTDSSGFPYRYMVDVENKREYLLNGLVPHQVYFLSVTCYDRDGNESWFSREEQITLNFPPRISNIPTIIFAEDDTLFLSDATFYFYVEDKDDPDSVLSYQVISGKKVQAIWENTGFKFFAPPNWFGSDTLQLIVNDVFQADTASLYITVNPVNDPPDIANIPEHISFEGDSSFTLLLWDYVSDVETSDSLLNYQFASENDSLKWEFIPQNGMLKLFAETGYVGETRFFITVTDDSNATVSDTINVTVSPVTGIADTLANAIPREYVLFQNYPNPFNPVTHIRFGLPKASRVRIEVFNILGQQVAILLDGRKPAGYHEVVWDAKEMSSGLYVYRIQASDFVQTRKMILMR